MHLERGQLSALAAVIREGSFERAARTLHVTPSAVSQRIKQLEELVGAILVVRSAPCAATEIGDALYRHALQVQLLEEDLALTIGPDGTRAPGPPMSMTIAVNADSLATWLLPALARFTERTGALVDLAVDDEDHTAEWLRTGRVLAAVTSEARPVQGCRAHPLGTMRYRATASPRFARRWFAEGLTADALRRAPALAYNRKDELSQRFVREVLSLGGVDLQAHFLPSPTAYVDASLRGLGWGMNPEPLVANHLARKRLVELSPGRWLDVPLFWQQWALTSPTLHALAEAVVTEAATSLPTRSGSGGRRPRSGGARGRGARAGRR